MKSFLKALIPAVVSCGLWANVCAARDITDETTALEAIRQAADPSAVVAAFAAGSAQVADDPKLVDAYVKRMVDLGVPEMAYHQAQALATMEPENGTAWAVVAYVDARKNNMPDALTAIERAARYAPDNLFVNRTAGGIIAWADSAAGQTALTASDVAKVDNLRNLVANRPGFSTAYQAARQAYSGGAQPNTTGTLVAPAPQVQATPPAGYPDYPYYSSDYPPPVGPEDYAYSYPDVYGPWPWWEPYGSFYGSFFVPAPFFVFGSPFFFGHHHHDEFFDHHHHHGFDHDRFIARGAFDHHGLSVSHFGTSRALSHSPSFVARPGFSGSSLAFSGGHSFHNPALAAPHFSNPSFGGFQSHTFTASPSLNHGFAVGQGAGGFHGGALGGGGFHGGGGVGHGGGVGGGGHGGGRR